MRRMRRDPLDDMRTRMQNIFDEFQDMGRDLTGMSGIPVDMHEEDGKIVMKADLPGVEKESISLKADAETLEIAAEDTASIEEENEKYYRKERQSRSFRRTVSWPTKIEPETVDAEFSDGVLTVTADKSETEGRDIEIQ